MPKKGGEPKNLIPPWRKGESGNLKGRPKRDRIDQIMDSMRDEVGYRPREQLLAMAANQAASYEARARIWMYLDEQFNGRPRQSIALTGDDDAPPVRIVHGKISKAQAKKLKGLVD